MTTDIGDQNTSRFKVTATQTPPDGCSWRVGDMVTFTNDYGVEFGPHEVLGFTLPGDELHGRFIYLDTDCYWFPVKPESLRHWENRELRVIQL